MALPVSPAPPSDDIAQRGWSALTIRVAWTMLAMGVKVRPDVLRDARQHALLHLDPTATLTHAEDVAEATTRRLVHRARTGTDPDPWPQDWAMPVSSRWRRSLDRSLTPLSRALIQHHYADNRPLKTLAQRMGVDVIALEASRGGLREVVRRAGVDDGVPLDRWDPERLDRLLTRLAAFAPAACPPLVDVLDGAHRSHVSRCTRCDRARRLVRRGVLTLEDLVPPSLGARPTETERVLALHFHPDGRSHRGHLARALTTRTCAHDNDVLLIDAADMPAVARALVLAAELALPARDHVRGALVTGPAVWSRLGLLGPLGADAAHEACHRPWGVVDTIGELPAPLPEPPSAMPLWGAVAALAVVFAVLLRLTVLAPSAVATPHALDVTFVDGRYGHWAAFDVADEACVTVLTATEDGLEVVLDSAHAADKVAVALGDGTYRVRSDGPLLVAAHATPVTLDAVLADAKRHPDPMGAAATALRRYGPVAMDGSP